MKIRILILIILMFLITPPSNAKTIKAGISYTVNSARIEAFTDIPTHIDIQKYAEHFEDKNYSENIKLFKKSKLKFKDRFVGIFSNGRYAVRYTYDPSTAYFYNSKGKLEFIDIDEKNKNGYPYRVFSYNIKGDLDTVALYISLEEQFAFNLDKKLIVHWIGKNGYNENGELIQTRRSTYE